MIPELDKKIIAYAISEKRLSMSLQTAITPEYMHKDAQPFYKLFANCFDKFREPPTPRVMEEQGGDAWNEQMADIYTSAQEVEINSREFPSDLEKLKTRYNSQLLLMVGKTIYKENWDGDNFRNLGEANLLLKRTVAGIDSIYGNQIFQEGSLSATAKDAWKTYETVRDNPEAGRGIHLGLREFDRITNGLQPGELMLIGGESSSGKSALAMQMAINAWLGSNRHNIPTSPDAMPEEFANDGVDVLFFTIEMPFKALRRRVDANVAGVPLYGVRDGTLTEDEVKRYQAALKFQSLYDKQFHIIDIPRGCTMSQIESKFIEVSHEFNPQLIVVDYISLMNTEQEGSDWLGLGKLSERLHEFCRAYQVSGISPVQLNRPEKTKEGAPIPPDQHRVGRSIMMPQNANIMLIIETRKDEELKLDMKIIIGKMREGERGAFMLHKRMDMMRIFDDDPGWSPTEYDNPDAEVAATEGEAEDGD